MSGSSRAPNPRYHPFMSKLLLNLRNVPDDEAYEVRALLDAHAIAHYETRPSLFGVSGGGIWIKDDDQAARAHELTAQYQLDRQQRAQAEYAITRKEGTAETLCSTLSSHPLRVLAAFFVLALVLALSAYPLLI